jgi:hypothetical protein
MLSLFLNDDKIFVEFYFLFIFAKQELLNKYGPNIPVDVVYRLMKQCDPNEESP